MSASHPEAGEPSAAKSPGTVRFDMDMIWPVGIAIALTMVVLVNIVFIVYAVNTSDQVDAAYVAGER